MQFKKLLLNPNYSFTSDGICRNANCQDSSPSEDLLKIDIENESRYFSKKWLGLLAHYEVALPLNDVLKIAFEECKSRVLNLRSGMLMTIKPRIELVDGFNIIPGFTNFAITKEGVVKSLKTGRILKTRIGPYGYPLVAIYDSDKNSWRGVSIHILLARTFVNNPDPNRRYFVNHKDGNKKNYKITNLEWVTSRQNSEHAFRTGLRNDNKPCTMRDTVTGQVSEFTSITNALKAIGFRKHGVPIDKNLQYEIVPVLFKNRYEIKLNTDVREWYHQKPIFMKSLYSQGPYEAKNLQSGEILEKATLSGLAKVCGLSLDRIVYLIRSTKKNSSGGYVFRIKSNYPWPTVINEVSTSPSRSIIAHRLESGEEFTFVSIRQVCIKIGIDKRTLKNRLSSGAPYKGWLLEEKKF